MKRRRNQPWPEVPEVPECFGRHRTDGVYDPLKTCPQCDGKHEHRWVEDPNAATGYAIPVRCSVCGARKCDVSDCWERRHHRGPHLSIVDGSTRQVGK